MNFEIDTYKKPEPQKLLSNLSGLKRLLKPIKVDKGQLFLDELLKRPNEILAFLDKAFSVHDHDQISEVSISIQANIPLIFWAALGPGESCGIYMQDNDGERVSVEDVPPNRFTLRKPLMEVLDNIDVLPPTIEFIKLVFVQDIGTAKCQLNFRTK